MKNSSLIGFSAITNNSNEVTENRVIPSIMEKFFDYLKKTKQKTDQLFAVYTDYQLDKNGNFDINKGNYTYFFGSLSSSITLNEKEMGLELLTIPNQNYQKFESNYGEFPTIVIDLWQKIWIDTSLHGKRNFIADFELYDIKNNIDPKNSQVSIFIGIK